MRKKASRYARVLIFLVVGILILWLITRGQDVELILSELRHANYFWIVLVMVLSLLSHLIRASRWNILIRSTGQSAQLRHTFVAVMSGYLSNLAVPRLGEITKCAALSKTSKIPMNVLIGTVVSERVVDFLSLVLIAILTISLQFSFISDFLNQFFFQPLMNLATRNSLLVVSVLLVFLVFGIALLVFFHRKLRNPRADSVFYKIRHQLRGFILGLKSLWRIRDLWAFFAQTLLIWMLYFLTVYLCFFAIGGTSHLSAMAGLTLLAMGSIGVMAPMPGGIGTYHFITIITLTELYQVAAEQATSYAYIAHASQMLVIIIFGTVAWMLLSMHQHKTVEAPTPYGKPASQLNK